MIRRDRCLFNPTIWRGGARSNPQHSVQSAVIRFKPWIHARPLQATPAIPTNPGFESDLASDGAWISWIERLDSGRLLVFCSFCDGLQQAGIHYYSIFSIYGLAKPPLIA